jgi:hypothetical protein
MSKIRDTGLEKLNLKHSISDRSGLSDQLVRPWLGNDPIALFISIGVIQIPACARR